MQPSRIFMQHSPLEWHKVRSWPMQPFAVLMQLSPISDTTFSSLPGGLYLLPVSGRAHGMVFPEEFIQVALVVEAQLMADFL